jgi:hypothetical protein
MLFNISFLASNEILLLTSPEYNDSYQNKLVDLNPRQKHSPFLCATF